MTDKPAASKDTVYIDADDEITSIINKIEKASHKVVALVLPKRTSALQSIVNMRLLKRSAEKADKSVVIITSEPALLPLAGAAGLHIAKNLHSQPEIPPSPIFSAEPKPKIDEDAAAIGDSSAKLDYHRSIGELAAGQSVDEPDAIALDDEDEPKPTGKKAKNASPKNKKLKIPNFEKFRLLMAAGVLGVFLLIFFIIFGLIVWPKAKITLRTNSLPVSAQFNLKTSDTAKTYDEAASVIPAVLKTQDQSSTQQVQATGQKNLGNKASGKLTMRTANCSGKLPSSVDAGTGAVANSLTFITQEKAAFSPTVDGGGNCYYTSGSVGILAQQGGSKYNLAAGQTFSISSQGLSGSNGAALGGGTDNTVAVISQSDVDGAKQKLGNANSDSAAQAFLKALADGGLYVISSTLKTSDPVLTASPDVGQQASTSTVTIKVTYSVLTLKKEDITQAINNKLDKQIDKKKQKVSSTDVLKDAKTSVLDQSSPTVANLRIDLDTTAIPIIDVASVQKLAAGKKTGDITNLLSSYPGVKSVDVKFSPFWVSKAPKKASKIIVIQEQIKENP